jgi:antirestriction protein ArdC
MKKQDYQEVVNQIIQAIQAGVKPWLRPFGRPAIGRAQNFFSKTRYQGANALLLSMEAYRKGYSSNSWLTYKQVGELKGKIRKGEHSSKVFFFTYVEKKIEDQEESDDEAKLMLPRWKYFNVFNLDQTEGLAESNYTENLPQSDFISNLSVDSLVNASKAEIKHSDRKAAYYSPRGDFIHLPYQKHFHAVDSYYATLLHELVHWTGHETRLDRLKAGSRFGDKAYSFEELVAELGATFLSIDLNVNADIENHASYLDGWAELLSDKFMAFFKAASLADKAAQYLYGLASHREDVQTALDLKAA